MRRAPALIRPLAAAALAAALLAAPALGQGRPGGGPQAAPREVGVVTLTRQQVPVTVTLPGRAVAFHQTAIRPQVGGEITEIAYQPGQPVSAGAVLFRLNDDQLAATLSAAEAAVTSAEAALEGAQATVNRYGRLSGTGVSRADLESAQVALANARAALSGAESSRDLARLAVARAEIRSPIDGVADLAAVSVGDLVTANQGDALTTVTQLDPIYVDVAESRARFLRNRAREAEGSLSRPEGADARLMLETGQLYAEGGRLVTPGVTVSATTGTVPIRLQFPNPDRLILPGQFVRVQLTVGMVEGVLVPQRATRRSAAGALTAFVARDGVAHEVALVEAGTHENAWIVTEGVAAGDALLLDGLTGMTDGTAVTPVPVAVDAEGVVRSAADQAGATGGDAGAATDPTGATAASADAPSDRNGATTGNGDASSDRNGAATDPAGGADPTVRADGPGAAADAAAPVAGAQDDPGAGPAPVTDRPATAAGPAAAQPGPEPAAAPAAPAGAGSPGASAPPAPARSPPPRPVTSPPASGG